MADATLGQQRGDAAHAHPQQPFLKRTEQCRADTTVALFVVDRDAQDPCALSRDPRDTRPDDPSVADRHDGGLTAVERLDRFGDHEQRRAGCIRRLAPDLDGLIEIGGVEVPDVPGAHAVMMSGGASHCDGPRDGDIRHPEAHERRALTDSLWRTQCATDRSNEREHERPDLSRWAARVLRVREVGYFLPGSLSSEGSVAPTSGLPLRRASTGGFASSVSSPGSDSCAPTTI